LRGEFSNGTQHPVTADQWKSSDSSILAIDSKGKVTGGKPGTATISAAHGQFSAKLNYTVTPAVVEKITVTFPSLKQASLPAGFETKAVAEGVFSDGSHSDLTGKVVWSSHDTSIATIDADGKLHTKAKGTVEILAKYKSVSGQAPLQVQIQSTGGSANKIYLYVHVIDNNGSSQPIVNSIYTVTTN
jgi:hypothetical protein